MSQNCGCVVISQHTRVFGERSERCTCQTAPGQILCSPPNFFLKKGLEEEQGERITLGNNGALEADLDHAGVSSPLAARRWQNRADRIAPRKEINDPHHHTSMQINSCLGHVHWFTGFAEDLLSPAFPTEWQARLGTALRYWWQTLPETEATSTENTSARAWKLQSCSPDLWNYWRARANRP